MKNICFIFLLMFSTEIFAQKIDTTKSLKIPKHVYEQLDEIKKSKELLFERELKIMFNALSIYDSTILYKLNGYPYYKNKAIFYPVRKK